MRVVVGGLLGLAALSAIASCRLDMTGLSSRDGGLTGIQVPGADAAAAGTGAAGNTAHGGQGGGDPIGAAAGTTGEAGSSAAGVSGGEAGAGAGTTGAAGDGAAGTGAAGTGAAGDGAAGTGAAGTGAAGTGAAGTGAAGTSAVVAVIGCADGTREGFVDEAKYPGIAACSGAWQIPGLVAPNTRTPQCQRHAGNTGTNTNGAGCSVADLCATGWHVCESVAEFKTKAADCIDVLVVIGGSPNFFATRQRGISGGADLTCDSAQNSDGTNNLHGCGNIGSPPGKNCAPFTRMMRDSDCRANAPWACMENNQDAVELEVVTKPGVAGGGVLCCH